MRLLSLIKTVRFIEEVQVDLNKNQNISSIDWRYRGVLSNLKNLLTHLSLNQGDREKEYYKSLLKKETEKVSDFLIAEIDKLKNSLAKKNEEIANLKKSRDDKVKKLNAQKENQMSRIDKRKILYVNEIIQWSIDHENVPSVEYTGLSLVSPSETIEKASDANSVFESAIEDINNYNKYARRIGVWSILLDEFYKRHLIGSN